MRYVLTIIAVALVVALSTALVAPFMIDWSVHRAEIEARLSAMTGAKVALTGPIAVRLLPTPYLALGEGSVSAPGPDAPKLSFASARLELALVKLAGGAIRFADIRLERPVLTVVRGADGALRLPAAPSGRAEAVGFDRLIVRDGEARIVSRANGAVREIAGVQLDAAAPSLDGPYQVSGQFSGPNGTPVGFHVASEKGGRSETPVRVSVDAGKSWPALEFDGALDNSASAGARGPSLSGSATLAGTVAGSGGSMPWRAVGRMTADLDRAAIEKVDFRLGPDERALAAHGSAALTYGQPARLTLKLAAKQANIDSLLRRKGEDGVAPVRALAFFSRALQPALAGPGDAIAIDADLSAESVILGAQTLPDATATLRSGHGAPLRMRFNLGLPGGSRLRGEGDLETGAAAKFRGAIGFHSGDIPLLGAWASLGAPDLAAKAAALGGTLPYRSGSLSGDIEASTAGFSGRNLELTLGSSTLKGSLAVTAPAGANPGRLSMDLSSDSLDVDALPNLEASAALIGDLDLSLSLRANSLHIARVGETAIDSGSMILKATKSGSNISLDRLSVAGLGGASVDAEGAIGPRGIVATGRLRADRLREFALLVSRLAPGEWSRMLADRAAALSPTSLTFHAHGPGGSDAGWGLDSLKADGTIGRTRVALAFDPGAKGGERVVTLSLDSPDASALLHQAGLGGTTVSSGSAHVALHASGAWASGYDVDATGALAGADLTWRGRFLPTAHGDGARLFGSVKLHGEDLAPLLGALGLAPAGGGALGPADVGCDATLRGDQWTLSRLVAKVAGVTASGALTYRPTPPPEAATILNPDVALAQSAVNGPAANAAPPAEITGELDVERLPLAALLALVLGPPRPVRAGTRWSEASFAARPINPPPTSVRLKVGALEVADDLPARDFATNLRLDAGRLDLDQIEMKVAGGAVSGHATLRRDRDNATLTGTLAANSIAVNRAGLSGRVSGTLDFASTGRSRAALIEGLAGGGTGRFAGAALARSDPVALDRVVARAQAPDARLDETDLAYELGNELNRGPLPIPDGSAPIALSAGELKFGPLTIARPRGGAALTGSLDLRKLAFATRLAMESSASGLKFWSGPPPSATIEVQDTLEGRKRRIDVSSLSAGLATQAIARESDRIAALDADIRERAFFNRRLNGEQFMDRRAAEIEDWRVEQARLKGLTERLQADREAAERAAAEKAAVEKAAADKAAAEKAAVEKAAAERALAEKAAAEKAAADKAAAEILGVPLPGGPAVQNPATSEADALGGNAPTPPHRPKQRPASADPTQSGLY